MVDFFCYGLAGQQIEGFLSSVFELLKLKVAVPDYSTLSRRRGQLGVGLPVKPVKQARHEVVDSSGVKVYGEG